MNKMADNDKLPSFVRFRHWVAFVYFPSTKNIVAFDAANPARLIKSFIEKNEDPALLELVGCSSAQAAQTLRNNYNEAVRMHDRLRAEVAKIDPAPASAPASLTLAADAAKTA